MHIIIFNVLFIEDVTHRHTCIHFDQIIYALTKSEMFASTSSCMCFYIKDFINIETHVLHVFLALKKLYMEETKSNKINN